METPSERSMSVGFIGLGAMGLGMASALQSQGKYFVMGYDINPSSIEKFEKRGGAGGTSVRHVAKSCSFLICMAATAQQIDTILFDQATGALQDMQPNAAVIICSTVPPTYYDSLPSRIREYGRPDVYIVDAPVSGGTLRAANGTLTIFSSGSSEALSVVDTLLRDMSEKYYIISGGLGGSSKVKMINQLLVGAQIAAASEAIGLATKAGLDTREVFEIIMKSAGNSWAWENRVPHMVDQDWTPLSALNIFVKDMGIVMSTSRSVQFPLPMASVAEQLYISGSSQGFGLEDDAGLVRIFLQGFSPQNHDQYNGTSINGSMQNGHAESPSEMKVGLIGLAELGQSIESPLAEAGLAIYAYEPGSTPHDEKVTACRSREDVCENANFLFLTVNDETEATDILFGPGMAANTLSKGCVIVLVSNLPPSSVRNLSNRLTKLNRDISLLDAAIMHGCAQHQDLETTMIYSGHESSIEKIKDVFGLIKEVVGSIRSVRGGIGAASTIKLIEHVLVGVHIATAAEAMAFSAHLNLDTRQIFDLLRNAAAWSRMFETRVPSMLNADWNSPQSISTCAKSLSLTLDEAKNLMFWAPLTSAAHSIYASGVMKGWANDSDASMVRLLETDVVSVAGSASVEV